MKYRNVAAVTWLFFYVGFSPVGAQQVQRMTLEQVFERAESYNRSLRTSDIASQEAEQAVKVAKSARMPEIEGSASFSYLGNARIWDRDYTDGMKAEMPHFGNNYALEASQVVYAGGAISAGIEVAELQHKLALLDKERNRQDIRLLLAGYYLELFRMQNQKRVYLQNISQTQKLIEEIKSKHTQGVALRNDVTRYELRLKSLELSTTQLTNSMAIINNQLATALQLPENTVIEIDTTLINQLPQSGNEQQWQELSTVSSPLLQQSKTGVEISKRQEKISRAERLPSVALIAGDKLDGPITIEVPPLDKNINYWYAGVGIKYSFSSLFKSNRKIRLSKLATQRAEEEFALAQDGLRTGVKAAYIRLEEAYTVYDTRLKSLDLALQNYAVVNNRYLNELALITDMLDASNAKLEAELQVENARIGILFNYMKLKKETGNL